MTQPEAIKGTSGGAILVMHSVGPQSANVIPNRPLSILRPFAFHLRPGSPTSSGNINRCYPAAMSFSAIAPEMPLPTSLAITGTGILMHKFVILSVNPEIGVTFRLNALLQGIEMQNQGT